MYIYINMYKCNICMYISMFIFMVIANILFPRISDFHVHPKLAMEIHGLNIWWPGFERMI